MSRVPLVVGLSLAAVVLSLEACAGAGSATRAVPPMADASRSLDGAGKISHVVVIVQENRSFDYLFHKYPGANTVDFGYGHGKKYVLQPWGLERPLDINHAHLQFLEDYDGGKTTAST